MFNPNHLFALLIRAFTKYIRMIKLRAVITIVSIAFLLYSIFGNFEKITQNALYSVTYFYIIIGLILSWFSLFINAIAWRLIINWLGYKEERINLIKLFLSTNIMKYTPGGIWHFVERFRVLNKQMVKEQAFLSVLLEPFIIVAAALLLVPLAGGNKLFSLLCFLPSILLIKNLRSYFIDKLRMIKIPQFTKLDDKLYIDLSNFNSIIYKTKYKLLLSLYSLVQFFFWTSFFILLLSKHYVYIVLILLFIKILITYLINFKIMKRLNVLDLYWIHPIYEIIHVLIQGKFVILNLFNKPENWKA